MRRRYILYGISLVSILIRSYQNSNKNICKPGEVLVINKNAGFL